MNESSITENITTTDINEVDRTLHRYAYIILKRLFDIIGGIVGLLLLIPVTIILKIAFLISGDTHPLFFSQERIGKNGKTFKLYKYRSMVPNADEILKELLKDPKIKKQYKKNMKLDNDPRITKIGSLIRKLSIDELPQLLNVLKGDMSLIGNRPYLPREKDDMGEYYHNIIKTKPGITGYWQVSGRSNISFNDRCKLESFYSQNRGFRLDIKIFFLTFYVVLFSRGAE
ncbi:MAG: sugar transferase [Bacilli bacterium]|nr:sugar transferase [Bacilli bacterium]